MNVPSGEQCLEILKNNKTPSNVIEHSKAVAKVAEEIADNLIKFGLINPETLSKQFTNLDKYIGMNIDLGEALKNVKCIKTKVPLTISFEIPKKIKFQEATPTENQNK